MMKSPPKIQRITRKKKKEKPNKSSQIAILNKYETRTSAKSAIMYNSRG